MMNKGKHFSTLHTAVALQLPAGGEIHTAPGKQISVYDWLRNEAADVDWWTTLLTKHGWKDVSRLELRRGKGIADVQRPGKVGREPSATYGATGPYFYVFSSNALPFEHDTAYSAFGAYALLAHGGDFPAAARALAAQGYGIPRCHGIRVCMVGSPQHAIRTVDATEVQLWR